MTNPPVVAVTYTGKEDPFKDRIYRSGLTFAPGQTRSLPEPLAARFLRHTDVFKRADAPPSPVTPAMDEQPSLDDTQAQLDASKKLEEDQRQKDSARFEVLESIEVMDREALIAWADQHYGQKIRANASIDKAREMARGFVDQYGLPA